MSAIANAVGSVFGSIFPKAPKINLPNAVAPPVRVSDAQLAERAGRRRAGQGFEANILSGDTLGGPTPTQLAGAPMNATGGAKPVNQTLLGG
jgi:hypothetical protein